MSKNIHEQRILILDFGSQYTQLIARRIREIGVYCELWSWDVTKKTLKSSIQMGLCLLVALKVLPEGSPRAPEYVFTAGVPVLGICYGMQTMSHQLGGAVIKGEGEGEFGYAQVEVQAESAFLKAIQDAVSDKVKPLLDVWMSHGDKVSAIPADFTTIANTATCQFAAMANEEKRFYGVQFHPEVTHTHQGEAMLRNFVVDICGVKHYGHQHQLLMMLLLV